MPTAVESTLPLPRLDRLIPAVEQGPHRFGFAAALALAAAVHAAPLVWMATRLPDGTPGAGGASLEAISIDMIDAAALEAMRAKPDVHGGSAEGGAEEAAAASLAREEVAAAAPPPAEAVPPDTREEAQLRPTETDAPELAAAETISETPAVQPKPRDHAPEVPPAPMADAGAAAATPREAQASSAAAAPSALAAEDRAASEGAAAASAGDSARYAVEVRLALGRVRPRHSGTRGRLTVEFALSETGSLVSVGIAGSSGVPALDDAALRAVRAARFPAPPPSLTAAQRRYVVPFEFR